MYQIKLNVGRRKKNRRPNIDFHRRKYVLCHSGCRKSLQQKKPMNYFSRCISEALKRRKRKALIDTGSPSFKEDTQCCSHGGLALNETEQKQGEIVILQASRRSLSTATKIPLMRNKSVTEKWTEVAYRMPDS